MAVILLLAVGSDYNLLLISRFKEEIHAGLNTGIIRAMAGSGSVVTSAGLVFAFTMCAFVFASAGSRPDRHHHRPRLAVRHLDRAFLYDAVDRRPARALVLVAAAGPPPPGQSNASPYGSRPAVRQLLLWDDPERPNRSNFPVGDTLLDRVTLR